MGQYADIKLKRIKKFIKYLGTKNGIEVKKGGKHSIIIKYAFGSRPFPIPCHSIINKYIIKDLAELLVNEWKICELSEIEKYLS